MKQRLKEFFKCFPINLLRNQNDGTTKMVAFMNKTRSNSHTNCPSKKRNLSNKTEIQNYYAKKDRSVQVYDANFKIKLNYFEFPVVFSIRDWFIEEKSFYKVRADVGLSYGYLFGIDAPGYDETNFKTHDVSYLIGAGINFTKRFGMSLRYTSSFIKVYKTDNVEDTGLLSYFLTLRSEYSF